jgi:Zn-dependent membrane protease YugP
MHPAVILIPVTALILVPRLWVGQVLKRHNRDDESLPGNAADLARAWLDAQDLQEVRVEVTDIGDHYDPESKAVRLSRDKFDRRSLTAVTTAAHEVSHAMQHAQSYPPFIWRTELAKLASVTGQIGTVVLLAVPAVSLLGRRPIPPLLVGSTLFVMLGTGLLLQWVSLASELDASFKRAMPLLRAGVVAEGQIKDARQILIACSVTYLASSLLSVLHLWPWLGRGGLQSAMTAPGFARPTPGSSQPAKRRPRSVRNARSTPRGTAARLMRRFGKPLIRTWVGFRLRPIR